MFIDKSPHKPIEKQFFISSSLSERKIFNWSAKEPLKLCHPVQMSMMLLRTGGPDYISTLLVNDVYARTIKCTHNRRIGMSRLTFGSDALNA